MGQVHEIILVISKHIMIIAAYFVVLHISVFYGAIMHFIADMICMPFYIKHKQYDVVIMLGFLMSIALSKVTLILAS